MEEKPRLPDNPEQYDTLEELEEAAREAVNKHNQTPNKELGGLTPEQTFQLLHANLDNNSGVIRLHKSLLDVEANAVEFVKNARILLENLREENGLPCTPKGNFKRKIVAMFLEKMDFPADYVERIRSVNKAINEQDIHRIERKDNRWFCTSAGTDLLQPGKGSVLLYHLFRSYFTEYNIEYFTRGPSYPGLQETITYSLYRISLLEERWYEKTPLIERITIPAVKEEMEEGGNSDIIDYLVSSRVLQPLTWFCLLDRREEGSIKEGNYQVSFRKNSLFDRFIEFNLS